MKERPAASTPKYLTLITENLAGLLGALFGVKDLFVFRYWVRTPFSYQRDFMARMMLLPGSLLLWGLLDILAPFINVCFGVLIGLDDLKETSTLTLDSLQQISQAGNPVPKL